MKKRSPIIKPNFPVIELTFISAMVFTLGLTIRQIIRTGEEDYLFVLPIILVGLLFGYFFTNYRNKKIYRSGEDLIVKPLLSKAKVLNKTNILGYELYESFDRTGLIKQVRLINLRGKKIAFAKDAYTDYEQLIQMIKNYGFENLGEKVITWRFKRQYGIIVGISFILTMMLWILLKLFEK